MKKLIILLAAALAAGPLFAAAVNEDMRIFVKEGEEVITRFPSQYLDNDARVNITFPKNYADAPGPFPAVYLLNNEPFDKEVVNAAFSKNKGFEGMLFIGVTITGGGKIGDFIAKELLPYIELNYKADNLPQNRTIAAGGQLALGVLEAVSANGGYFYNAALLLADNMPMPGLKNGLNKNLKIFAAGRAGNIARLQQLLEEKGLKFIDNFTARVFEPAGDWTDWQRLDFAALPGADRVVSKVTARFSASKISAEDKDPLQFWLDVKTKGGRVFNYVPRELKISPPFLSWDANLPALTVIYGATPGKVKLSGPLYFYNKGFETGIKIAK